MMEKISAVNKKTGSIRTELSNRTLLAITIAYIIGIAGARLWISDTAGIFWLTLGYLAVLSIALFYRVIDLYRVILLLAVSAAGGIAFFYALQQPAGGLLNYSGTPLYLEGTVADEPIHNLDHSAYRLKVNHIETGVGRKEVSGTILVKIYGPERENFWFGEQLRMRGIIVEPRGQRNPGGFDYRYYLNSQGIDALIYPHPTSVDRLGPGNTGFITASAIKMRSALVGAINLNLPSPSSELLVAILFGQRHQLPDKVEENFRRSGAGHLMAVSGLHVGLVAALILGLWKMLKLQGRGSLILAIALVFAYAYLTGMRPSAMRAAIMTATALGAMLMDREQDLPTAVAFAAITMLFINPLLLFTAGFQLSYAATLTLIYGYRPVEQFLALLRCPQVLRGPLAVTVAAQVGVLPLSVYYFQYLPTGALIFNLLLLPMVAFAVGFGLVGAFLSLLLPLPGALLLWAARPILELMIIITGWSSFPGFYTALYPPGLVYLFLFYGLLIVSLAIFYHPEKLAWIKRALSCHAGSLVIKIKPVLKKIIKPYYAARIFLILAVIILWSGILFPAQQILKVTFIDVGQGAAALIESPCGAVIMVDAGGEPAFRGDPGAIGEKVLLPFFRFSQIKKLDLAVITHPHEDHFGGFIPLIEEMPIGRFLISPLPAESLYYTELLELAGSKGIPVTAVTAGDSWRSDCGLVLDIIAPPEKLLSGTNSDLNNNSIVFLLHYGEIRMLFTGDIEDETVNDLLRREVDLKADLILVPHHGGYLGAMPALLDAVKPSAAIIQVGVNPFGHPHPFVITALDEAGVTVFRNDHHGAVIAETDGKDLQITVTESPALTR